MYLVEMNGKRSPVIAFNLDNSALVLQGLYLPQFGRSAVNIIGESQNVDLDGQQATLRVSKFSSSAVITVRRGDTWVEISGAVDKDKAVQLAKSLELVQ